MRATIFDIQRYSLHDGPGIRTTVFFKGCPLHCLWCCNPESQSQAIELGYHLEKCIGCGSCVKACPQGMISLGEAGIHIDQSRCAECEEKFCTKACPAKALVTYGRMTMVEELIEEVAKDAAFFSQSGGGITASGGEPLAQPNFLARFFAECQRQGFHTAVETSSAVRWAAFEAILPYTDLFLCDLKHVDPEAFHRQTKGDLSLVLENLAKLRERTERMIIRVPLIPGFNDDEETLAELSGWLSNHEIADLHLLPFHRLGDEKYRSMGRAYAYGDNKPQTPAQLQQLAAIARAHGLHVQLGG